jgi:hypothetical protein
MTVVAGAAVLAASYVTVAAPAASAAGCSVTNAATGVRSSSLQSAVKAAAAGQTLRISGTCKGNVTIGKSLTLLGVGTNPTLRGNGGRPLTITGGPVTVDRLRITGGIATSCFGAPAGVACGGGIAASKRLIVKRSLIEGNTVSGSLSAQGGGIAVITGGSLKVVGSVIRDNTITAATTGGGAFGGGIAAFAPASISGSVIDGNVANGGTATGGGILADFSAAGDLTVTTTLVRDNTALGDGVASGGGIATEASATLRLTRSTVAGNTVLAANEGFANASAGGIKAGSAVIVNSTITGNTVTSLAIGVGIALAGGLQVGSGTIVASTIAGNKALRAGGALLGAGIEIGTTIIAANTGTIGVDCETENGVDSLGRNLIGNAAGCGTVFDDGVKGDKVGNDNVGPSVPVIVPKLAALANNGGPTPTRALKAGSPAIDAGGGKPCSTTADQRGVKRPKGARCDIGAFEKS